MVSRGAEVHGGGVDHVAVEIRQRTVGSPANVPAKLGVTVEVAADNLHLASVDGGTVAAQSVQVSRLVGMPGLDLDYLGRPRGEAQRRGSSERSELADPGFTADGPMSPAGGPIVGRPSEPNAAVGSVWRS